MTTPTEDQIRSRWKSWKFVIPILTVAVILLLSGVSLWLNTQIQLGIPTMTLIADSVYLGTNGLAAFHFVSTFDTNIAITTAKAYQCAPNQCSPFTGTNATFLASLTLSANNVVPAHSTITLAVQFQGLTWQSGVRYAFDLLAANGDRNDLIGCVSGC